MAEDQAGGALELLPADARSGEGLERGLVAVDGDHAAAKLGRADQQRDVLLLTEPPHVTFIGARA